MLAYRSLAMADAHELVATNDDVHGLVVEKIATKFTDSLCARPTQPAPRLPSLPCPLRVCHGLATSPDPFVVREQARQA